jgi:hypothetical protein
VLILRAHVEQGPVLLACLHSLRPQSKYQVLSTLAVILKVKSSLQVMPLGQQQSASPAPLDEPLQQPNVMLDLIMAAS